MDAEGRVHFARQRPTGARLVGLCLPNPIKTVGVVLDHAGEGSSLGYVLAGPNMQSEFQDVRARCLAVLRAMRRVGERSP